MPADYVLRVPGGPEAARLEHAEARAADAVEPVLAHGVDRAMNSINQRRQTMADRRYETLVLIHPDLGEPGEELAAYQEAHRGSGERISQVQEWGIRDLSYLIAKQRRGFYVLYEYRSSAQGALRSSVTPKLMDHRPRYVSVRQAGERRRHRHGRARASV